MKYSYVYVAATLFLILFFPVASVVAQGQAQPGFTNPLGEDITITSFLANLTRWLLGLVGFLAMLALVWGGIQIIISFGDDSKVKDGKDIIKWAIIGLVIVSFSYVIVRTISGFLGVQ